MATLTKAWLIIISCFEFVAVGRRLLLEAPITELQPLHSRGLSEDGTIYWIIFAITLAIIRLIQSQALDNKALWAVTACVHMWEVVAYGWWLFIHDKAQLVTLMATDNNAKMGLGIYGIVLINAIWFTAAWISTPSKQKTA